MSNRTRNLCLVFSVVCAASWGVRADDRCSNGNFLLDGNARNDQDPENPANDVIRIDTAAPPPYGSVSRRLGVKIAELDNMLEFKSYFQNRSCGGGSPRIQLAIDLDGDGKADGNAFAYTAPPFTGCPPNRWQYDDVTDELPRWDASQLAASGFVSSCDNPTVAAILGPLCPFKADSGYIPWPVFKALLTALFPNHRVCAGALVDDSGWFPAAAGIAYYDLISLGRATWHNREDTSGRGFARGCRPNDGRQGNGD